MCYLYMCQIVRIVRGFTGGRAALCVCVCVSYVLKVDKKLYELSEEFQGGSLPC